VLRTAFVPLPGIRYTEQGYEMCGACATVSRQCLARERAAGDQETRYCQCQVECDFELRRRGVTGGERTGGDLGGPRETDCVPGHIGLEPANPGAGHLIVFA
jgi:hypothetical protein